MNNDVAELLRSMPDLQPVADGWQRITACQARQASLYRARLAAGLAVAAVGMAILFTVQHQQEPDLTVAPAVAPIVVSAPVMPPATDLADAQLREWQQRSQHMQQVLSGLPRRGPVVRADTAGVIAELEDRIAAVDYQLNRVGLRRADRLLPRATGFDQVAGAGYQSADEPDLWRRRAEYMGQLVRARYTETGASGF
ncbi:MAG: hypothetical protein QF483_00395 [Gammaproteobacteria bacterium]|jgi:hypothetical protein|nr:hypothetical protein [Chromatiales bacterium]MCP4926965.1 hypothetical protein [Gammaproteobacteria bacterium]MDP6151389.1 hypothetical protein [Gammaproteobacteria bacterium]MDP7153379.1 hypothetical protein [Gammaproteobacteria bacterium]MDP7296784.1 hypothetical protein [Gammaproteobacteria bacterium]